MQEAILLQFHEITTVDLSNHKVLLRKDIKKDSFNTRSFKSRNHQNN